MGGPRYEKRGKSWRYLFDGAKIDGKRHVITKGGFRTKKEAIEAGNKAFEEYNRAGAIIDLVDVSFSDYLDLWMNQYVRVNCKPVTITNYEKKIRLHIKPILGKYYLSSLNPLVLQKLIDEKFNEGYSRNTLAVLKGILTGCLSYAVQPLGYLKHSPALYLKLPSTRVEAKVQTRSDPHVVVTREQMEMLLNRFPEGSSSYLPLMIGYKCGMRLGEVFGLTWDCVDFEQQTITINKQMQWQEKNKDTGASGYWYFSKPKYNSVRTINISSELKDILLREQQRQTQAEALYGSLYTRNYINDKRVLNAKDAKQEVKLVLVRMDGSYIISRNMQYVSQVATRELGMAKFDFHSLRHTHATMLAEAGASPKYVQHRLGHKNIQVTMQVYQHLTKNMVEKDSKLLDSL